jgi:hypothetical protein
MRQVFIVFKRFMSCININIIQFFNVNDVNKSKSIKYMFHVAHMEEMRSLFE